MTASRRVAVASFVGLGIVWGVNFVFMQMAAPYLSAAQTTLVRVVAGAVPILALALATRSLSWGHLRHVHHFAVQAVLAAGFYYYAYIAGTYRLESSIAGVLSGSIPIFASIGALLIFRTEAFSPRKVLSVLVGAAGVVLLAQPWTASGIDLSGVAWMLAGSASLGLSFGYARRFITPLGIPAAASASYQMVLAAIAFGLIADLRGLTEIARDTGALIGVVLGLGVLGTGIAFVLYYLAVDGLGALTASTATCIAPVVALVVGVGLLGEALSPVTIGAVVLILGAAVLTQLPDRRRARAARQDSVRTD